MIVTGDKERKYDPIPDIEASSRVRPVLHLSNGFKALRVLVEGQEPK